MGEIGIGRTVEAITANRKAKRAEVDTNLVGASCEELTLNERRVWGGGEVFDGGLSELSCRVNFALYDATFFSSDWLEKAELRVRKVAMDDCQI